MLRFANSIFEPLFNQKYIDHVQITVAEEEGVGTRAGYYEQAGALRDMVQNHLLQLLALVAMEPPHSLDADVVRDEKLEVLQSLRPIDGEAVDAQRRARRSTRPASSSASRCPATARRQGVDPTSRTETFVALQVVHRQLALGRRAVLPAHRQAAAEARERDLDPPEGACRRSCSTPIRAARARSERAVDPHPARRGVRARHQLEGARAARPHLPGEDGFPVRQHVRRHRRPRRTSGCCST